MRLARLFVPSAQYQLRASVARRGQGQNIVQQHRHLVESDSVGAEKLVGVEGASLVSGRLLRMAIVGRCHCNGCGGAAGTYVACASELLRVAAVLCFGRGPSLMTHRLGRM